MTLFLEIVFGALSIGLPVAFAFWKYTAPVLKVQTPAEYTYENNVAPVLTKLAARNLALGISNYQSVGPNTVCEKRCAISEKYMDALTGFGDSK